MSKVTWEVIQHLEVSTGHTVTNAQSQNILCDSH